jgi:hypothetical protein
MKTTAAAFSVLVFVGASTVQAQQYERTADVPARACIGLTVRQCMKLAKDYGVGDDNCYQARWRDLKPDYTVGDCLKVRAQLREMVRRRLDGTLPPTPQQPDSDLEKHIPWYLRDGTAAHRAEMLCVDDPHAGRTCIGLPPDLDAPEPP